MREFYNYKKLFFLVLLLATTGFSVNSYARVYSGLEVFLNKYTNLVKGKRVGLITNQTGVDGRGRSTVDLLYNAKNVNLVALFAPEHGIRGKLKAGELVPGGRDSKTGLPIYSLYGGYDHRPPKAALDKVDILIYDIQDVGSRAYTYIWTMAEAMSAVAESGKTMIVLDRPNPFGGVTIDGPITENKFLSFIGLYPIPRVYGMTAGELAYYLNRVEKIGAKLYIVPMANYRRGMSWSKTGLPWIPPSPNIPSPMSAYCFAATGTLGETGRLNLGIGTKYAFQIVAAPWMKAKFSAAVLNSYKLPGVKFIPITYKNSKGSPKKGIPGVRIVVTNPRIFRPTTTEVAILYHLHKSYSKNFRWPSGASSKKLKSFDKAMGTAKVRKMIEQGKNVKQIAKTWQQSLQRFNHNRKKYLIYK